MSHVVIEADKYTLCQLTFAVANKDVYDRYTEMRLHGYHSSVAFRTCFPPELTIGNDMWANMFAVEFNPYVVSRLRDLIAKAKASELWNPNISIHEFLSLARDPNAKDSSRVAAMKELNVMLDITVVDEHGKTKKGRSLDDFYRSLAPSEDPKPEAQVEKAK